MYYPFYVGRVKSFRIREVSVKTEKRLPSKDPVLQDCRTIKEKNGLHILLLITMVITYVTVIIVKGITIYT